MADVQRFTERLERVGRRMAEAGVDRLLVGPGTDLRWLTGFVMRLSERPTVLALGTSGGPRLVTPRFEVEIARREPVGGLADLHGWEDGDPPVALLARHGVGDAGVVAVADGFPAAWLLPLQAACPGVRWVPAAATLGVARMTKDAGEVAALHAAGAAIDAVHARVAPLLEAGRTEDEVAGDIAAMIGEEHDTVGFVIVGSGPNGAIPHHDHGSRVLEVGDPVVVDIGGPRGGYWSDCTRTYVVGGPGAADPHVREVAAAVAEAQEAAFRAVQPGVVAQDLDRVARDLLRAVDLGGGTLADVFSHRLGHGIGLLGHEAPYLVRGDETVLEPGMAFSIEPGAYLPGRFGVRWEDIVVVTEDGADRCNHRPLELA